MSKRKFSGDRLYNLLKNLVIVITLLALFFAAVNYNQINSNEYKRESDKCYQEHPNHMSDQIEGALWSSCLSVASEVLKLQNDNLTRYSLIVIILPLIFFGGTWLYKYLFPKKID